MRRRENYRDVWAAVSGGIYMTAATACSYGGFETAYNRPRQENCRGCGAPVHEDNCEYCGRCA